MKDTPRRSLAGKARRSHHRNRATRLYTRQWIDEYLDVDTEEQPSERFIPIRGRKEFLPTVAQANEPSMSNRESQLELPLSSSAASGGARHAAASAEPAAQPPEDRVIRFPTRAKSPAGIPFKAPVQFHRRSQFTIGGFLLGCAMGSAAAAMVLLVVQVVVL